MKAHKRICILLLTVCICAFLFACSKSEEAVQADELIENIGEITLDSESEMIEAVELL